MLGELGIEIGERCVASLLLGSEPVDRFETGRPGVTDPLVSRENVSSFLFELAASLDGFRSASRVGGPRERIGNAGDAAQVGEQAGATWRPAAGR
jgi:hypothetical protein